MTEKINEEIALNSMHEKTSLITRNTSKKWNIFFKKNKSVRQIVIGKSYNYSTNAINNQKYNLFTFIPLVLYNQFKFFLNLYFLIVALTQFINQVKIGYLYTYWGPLCFVLLVTMIREAIDDFRRYQRDKEVNSTSYVKVNLETYQQQLASVSFKVIKSADIKVGDIIIINKNQRVPADVILLKSSEANGSCFIKTDQLDGETDWKSRKAIPFCQTLPAFNQDYYGINAEILNQNLQSLLSDNQNRPFKSYSTSKYQTSKNVSKNLTLNPSFESIRLLMSLTVEPPRKDIHTFSGSFYAQSLPPQFNYQTSASNASDSLKQVIGQSLSLFNNRSDCYASEVAEAQSVKQLAPVLGQEEVDVEDNNDTLRGNTKASTTYKDGNTQIPPPRLLGKENIDIEYTMWSSCVLASEGYVWGVVIYTGRDTRSCMNTSQPRSKVGLTDLEINRLTKILFVSVITLSMILMVLKGFSGPWYRYFVRFILLFSYIIPISLRVNLDLAKMAYAYMIMRDKDIPGNVVRNTTIPEELGRIRYLFTDKTGTLTKNQMKFKRLYLGQSCRSVWDSNETNISKELKIAEATFLYRKNLTGPQQATKSVFNNQPLASDILALSGSTLASSQGVSLNDSLTTNDTLEHSPSSSTFLPNNFTSSSQLPSHAFVGNLNGQHAYSPIADNRNETIDESSLVEDDLYETLKAICICNNVTPIYTDSPYDQKSSNRGKMAKTPLEKILTRHKALIGKFPLRPHGLLKVVESGSVDVQSPSTITSPKNGQTNDTSTPNTVTINNNSTIPRVKMRKGDLVDKTTGPTNSKNPEAAAIPTVLNENRNSLTESVVSNSTCDSTSQLISQRNNNSNNPNNLNMAQSNLAMTPEISTSSSSTPSSSTSQTTNSQSFGTTCSSRTVPDHITNQQRRLSSANITSYQASSPDEVALVTWSKKVGMKLIHRDTNSLKIKTPLGRIQSYSVLKTIPFSSDRKMMGSFVKDESNGSIFYYIKGADNVISKMANLAANSADVVNATIVREHFNLLGQGESFSPTHPRLQNETGSRADLQKINLLKPSTEPVVVGHNDIFSDVDLMATTGKHIDLRHLSDDRMMYFHSLMSEDVDGSDAGMGHLRKRSDGLDLFNQNVNEWIEEESGNLAQEGLRTLAIARMSLTAKQYNEFASFYDAKRHDKETLNDLIPKGPKFDVLGVTGVEDKLQDGVPNALEMIRNAGIKIWMLTGDKLETAICIALSSHLIQRNQALYVFQDTFVTQQSTSSYTNLNKNYDLFDPKSSPSEELRLKERILRELNSYRALKQSNTPIVMTGPILEVCLKHYESQFMESAIRSHCVIICRASPTQKSHVVHILPKYYDKFNKRIKLFVPTTFTSSPTTYNNSSRNQHITADAYLTANPNTSKQSKTAIFRLFERVCCCRCGSVSVSEGDGDGDYCSKCKDAWDETSMTKCVTCAIGDGGNDVSMIQVAHVGVGIVGKEGKQASLAADFSITQFSHLTKLILVHGRYSYKRTAALSQFIIHRGLIISVMQAIFSAIFFFASIALYQGYLMIGYATIYTMFPVFSIILDRDISPQIAMTYPELYKELVKGRSLSFKTFFIWVLISTYQGSVIMFGAFLLFEDEFVHVVSITFTALILNELLMVTLTVRRWRHWAIISSEMFSLTVYLLSLVLFRSYYFDRDFVLRSSLTFVWKVCAVTLVSCVPLVLIKVLTRKFAPPIYAKLTQ